MIEGSARFFSGGAILVGILVSACGDDGDKDGHAGAGGAGTGGAAVNAGGTGPSAGGGPSGNGGTPLRPPNPRTDIGPPDGTPCVGVPGPALSCAAGQQCCPGSVADPANECVAPGTICQNCTFGDCGSAACDGPEDCPGKLCCLTETSCDLVGAPCTGVYAAAACADRCEPGEREAHHVVCKDPRDCLLTTEECLERAFLPNLSTCR
jgi:hypothetical protein